MAFPGPLILVYFTFDSNVMTEPTLVKPNNVFSIGTNTTILGRSEVNLKNFILLITYKVRNPAM